MPPKFEGFSLPSSSSSWREIFLSGNRGGTRSSFSCFVKGVQLVWVLNLQTTTRYTARVHDHDPPKEQNWRTNTTTCHERTGENAPRYIGQRSGRRPSWKRAVRFSTPVLLVRLLLLLFIRCCASSTVPLARSHARFTGRTEKLRAFVCGTKHAPSLAWKRFWVRLEVTREDFFVVLSFLCRHAMHNKKGEKSAKAAIRFEVKKNMALYS